MTTPNGACKPKINASILFLSTVERPSIGRIIGGNASPTLRERTPIVFEAFGVRTPIVLKTKADRFDEIRIYLETERLEFGPDWPELQANSLRVSTEFRADFK